MGNRRWRRYLYPLITPKIFLKSREEKRILQGHLWVFSNEIAQAEGPPEPGSIVDIYSHQRKFLGRGFCNPHSLIACRILTHKEEEIDLPFFARRVAQAKRFREKHFPRESSYRLIFGESDFLPGLIVDRYGEIFVVQSYCLGMDLLLEKILPAIEENFSVKCMVKKNDSPLRAMENLVEEVEIVKGKMDVPIQITQGFEGKDLSFFIDPIQGQKSGFFLDQRENRERLKVYAPGKRVLDCYSYVGGFGVYAAASGAKEVTCVESSESACQLIEKNFRVNGFKAQIIKEDVFTMLERANQEKRKFDIIVLDPPALAKSKKNLFASMRKYRQLNQLALSVIESGGLLISSSCSHHLPRANFLELLCEAGSLAGKQLKLLEMRGQSRDHPVMISMPETEYLKCAILQVD